MHTVVHEVRSPPDRPLALWIEPWGDEIVLPTGAVGELRATSPEAGDLEIVPEERGVVIYAWSGATLQVFASGSMLQDYTYPVPYVPAGMSVRAFLGVVLGPDS